MVRALVIVILTVLSFAGTAHAGVCLSEDEANDGMAAIEAFAKDRSKAQAIDDSYGWLCVELDAIRLRPRIERACRKILDRDGLKSRCAHLAGAAGIAKLGAHDLYAFAIAQPDDPITYADSGLGVTRTTMLGRMGDPRAVPVIVERWKAAIPRAAKLEKRRHAMMSWSLWRQHAAATLGALGGKDEIAFLGEQAKATKDRFVAKACRDAIAAIEKRLAPATTPRPVELRSPHR